MFIDYFLRIALIVVLSMTMVNSSKAGETCPITWQVVQSDGSCISQEFSFTSVQAAFDGYVGSYPKTCGGVAYTISNPTLVGNVITVTVNPSGGTPYQNVKTVSCVGEPCPANGTPLSAAGYYDVGTSTTVSSPPLSTCHNGCLHNYVGDSVGFRAVIGGVYHYYAKGFYESSGGECTAGPSVPDFVSAIPSTSCAPGQNYGTVNGKLVCLNSDGSVSGTDSAEALAAAAAAEAARLQDIADKARQAAEAAAAAAGGTAEEITAAGNVAAATAAGAAAAESVDDSPLGKFCEDNPDAPICIETDYGEVDDVEIENKTIDVAITPVAVSGDGSCPAPSPLVIRGQTYWFEWTTYCNFASGIKPILLAFAWLSAAGIMVGGFRT